MPATFDANGLEIQTQQEVFAEIQQKIWTALGINVNVSPTSNIGQLANIVAELVSLEQQAALGLYASRDPNEAQGAQLDALCALTGTTRRGETFSTIEGIITFSGPGTVNNGDLIVNTVTGTQWEAINGPYADSGGPYPEEVPGQYQAVAPGPILAPANTVWGVVTVSPGVQGFTNPLEDATPGAFEESDEDLRRRRNTEVYSQNAGPLNSIAAVVSKVNTDNGTVDRVKVYHNPDIFPVSPAPASIPFKAFNVVVRTTPSPVPVGLQQDIADAIFRATGAGGQPYGTDYGPISATDIAGNSQQIYFDEFQDLDVWIRIDIYTAAFTGSGNYPIIPLDPAVMAALVRDYTVQRANEELTGIGQDVQYMRLVSFINELVVTNQLRGVDKYEVEISDSNLGPFEEVLFVDLRSIPDFDTGRVLVFIDEVQIL